MGALGTVLGFLGLTFLVWLPFALFLLWRKGWRPGAPLRLTFPEKLRGVLSLYLVIPGILWLYAKTLPLYGLTLSPTGLNDFLGGLTLGVLGLGALLVVEIRMHWVVWQDRPIPFTLITTALALGVGVALVEELLFRGFMLMALASYRPLGAALVSSIIFALLHLIWEPMAAWRQSLRVLPGLTLMGLVLSQATFLQAGEINVAWGLHAAWVWGITVLDTSAVLTYSGKVPAWVTGFDQKPLAGLMGWSLLGVTALVLWLGS